jgi:DNA polymerase IV
VDQPVRHIAHLDMDAFYASVELLRYPELKGRPVVIGGGSASTPQKDADGNYIFSTLARYVGRGVATTSTYEARALGVYSAMGLMKAAKLAPDAVLLPTDFNSYRHYSKLFKAAVASIAPAIEDRGIDEIYIDLTGLSDDMSALARQLQSAVFDATGLHCSIGIAPNKLLAKICSDLEKPKGLTIIDEADIQTRIWPLPVKKINGIGPKATEKLAKLDIHTIAQLASADLGVLQAHFGRSYSAWLGRVAQGIDDRPIATRSEPKSMSRETTFERDLHPSTDKATLTPLFTKLCEKVADDLVRKGYVGRTIGIKLRYADFTIVTRDITLEESTDNAAVIRKAAGECLRRVSFDKRLRLLGVKVNGLSKRGEQPVQVDAPQQELTFG